MRFTFKMLLAGCAVILSVMSAEAGTWFMKCLNEETVVPFNESGVLVTKWHWRSTDEYRVRGFLKVAANSYSPTNELRITTSASAVLETRKAKKSSSESPHDDWHQVPGAEAAVTNTTTYLVDPETGSVIKHLPSPRNSEALVYDHLGNRNLFAQLGVITPQMIPGGRCVFNQQAVGQVAYQKRDKRGNVAKFVNAPKSGAWKPKKVSAIMNILKFKADDEQ